MESIAAGPVRLQVRPVQKLSGGWTADEDARRVLGHPAGRNTRIL